MAKLGFDKELNNWSTYQDKQLDVLNKLSSSFVSSLATSKLIQDNLTVLKNSIESIAKFTHTTSGSGNQGFTSAYKGNIDIINQFGGVISTVTTASSDAAKAASELEDSLAKSKKAAEEAEKAKKKAEREEEKLQADREKALNYIWQKSQELFKYLGESANKYSKISNELIQTSGMRGSEVQELRTELVDVVRDLNKATGNAYEGQASYQNIVNYTKGVTSNLEALQEMTRPLLLTQETLDVNMTSIATLFNRFYTRYNFSSSHMEEALEKIRGNTANSAASAQNVIENTETLMRNIEFNNVDNDPEKLQKAIEELSQASAWVDSMGGDSKLFTKYAQDIYEGKWNDTGLLSLIHAAGYDPATMSALAKNNEIGEIFQALLEGGYVIADSKMQNIESKYHVPEILNIAKEFLYDAHNMRTATKYVDLETYAKQQSAYVNTSSEDLVEDKYYTLQERNHNLFSTMTESLASIQEKIGFGFSDVVLVLGNISSAIASIKILSALGKFTGGGAGKTASLLSKAKGLFGSGAAKLGGGLLKSGAAGSAGAGLAVAGGAAAGGLLAWDGAKDMISDIQSGDSTGAAISGVQAAGGAIGAGALIALGASNPIGWIALAVSGIALVAKAAYDNAKALSGNAVKVKADLQELEKSLKQENKDRLEDLSLLRYQFNQESDVEAQRQLLRESGLISEEELNNTADANLKKLIDSYVNAAAAMDKTTEGLLKTAEKYYSEQQDAQQKGFVEHLMQMAESGLLSEDQMTTIVDSAKSGITDEKTLKKIDRLLKDGKITNSEFNDFLYGGKDSWFDQMNIKDQALDVNTMRLIAGYIGWDKEFLDTGNMETITSYMNAMSAARTQSEKDAIWKKIVDEGLEEEARSIFASTLKIHGYADGTNYITHDQLAVLHEGEAVVPKKYNPAINSEESKRIAAQLQESQLESAKATQEIREEYRAFREEIQGIKELLSRWQTESNRNAIAARMTKSDISSYAIKGYLVTDR